jgi:hypothetical protein
MYKKLMLLYWVSRLKKNRKVLKELQGVYQDMVKAGYIINQPVLMIKVSVLIDQVKHAILSAEMSILRYKGVKV